MPHPPASKPLDTRAPGGHLRERVEELGARLSETLVTVLSQLPRRSTGPQRLADGLGITVVTASRLLKAVAQTDPVAVLQLLPGPKPLRQFVAAARGEGAGDDACAAAAESIDEFNSLIKSEAGDRSALKAMLTAWLPEERRAFEAERRQSIFRAMRELDGVSCELDLTAIFLNRSAADPTRLDIVDIECRLGIDRMRPDAPVKLGTRRLHSPQSKALNAARTDTDSPSTRQPRTLTGEIAAEGLYSVRLDEFCTATPAPLAIDPVDEYVQYSLGPTGFGADSSVDLVLAELNLSELPHKDPGTPLAPPFFFTIPELPSRRKVFDLLVHQDVYPGCSPELLLYDTRGRGPAKAADPHRRLDLRSSTESVEALGTSLYSSRLLEFPPYGDLQAHVCAQLGWDRDAFRVFRVRMDYPLVGAQITQAFLRPPE